MKVCLDLFSGLGGFSAAFRESDDWEVITVEIDPEHDPDIQADIMDLRPGDLPDADVILASPPCEEFSPAQNMNGKHSPDPEAIALVYHTIGLIKAKNPDYWFMENPRGRLRTLVGQPSGMVTYCQYGEEHMKPTDLWGEHPPGFRYHSCNYGDSCHVNNRDGCNTMRHELGKKTASDRSLVPYKLSKAIRDAVEDALAGRVPEQASMSHF